MPDELIDYLNQLDHPTPPPAVATKTANPFRDLPALMKTIIDKDISAEMNMTIEQANGLTPTQGDRMMGVIRKVILKTIGPEQLVETIKRDVNLDDERAKKLALDLLMKRFLPMEWYIGKVQPLIQQLGGNIAESLAEARQRYPEVYSPKPTAAGPTAEVSQDHPILKNFDERATTLKGQADILLRLTGLSSQIEAAVAAGRLTQPDGERLMQDLDAVSYAVNTQDLNPFEINSIKRKIRKIIARVETAS